MSMSILLAVGVSLIDIQVFHFIWTHLLNDPCHQLLFVSSYSKLLKFSASKFNT